PSGPPGWIDANTANAPGGGETWRVVLVPHIAGDADAPVLGLDDPPRGGSIPVPLALPPIAVADGRATAARFMLPYAADAYAAGEKAGSATIDVFFASDFFAAPAPPGAETRWTTQTTLLACVDARLPGLGHGRRCVEFPAPGADRAFVPPPVGDGAGPRLGLEVMRVGSGEK
ncbi:hypothetical protein K8I61_06165, partial [bacterium]|nr:hypothetical protein [bacterium]